MIAPSSPFEHVLARVGLGWLAQRYRVLFDAGGGPPLAGDGRRGGEPSLSAPSSHGLFARTGYLAGSDARRSDELARALSHPDVRAIFAARGGYGANRFVHRLDWRALARAPALDRRLLRRHGPPRRGQRAPASPRSTAPTSPRSAAATPAPAPR